MGKKTFTIVSLVICSISVISQKKMSQNDFERLVDYANCRYLIEYIERNNASDEYLNNTYFKEIKPELQKGSLDDLATVPSIEIIENLLKSGSNESALKLALKINERKNAYSKLADNNLLIDTLRTTIWNRVDLKNVAEKIISEVKSKYPSESIEIVGSDTIVDAVSQSQPDNNQLNQLNENIRRLEDTNSKLWLFGYLIVGAFLLFLMILVVWYKYQINNMNRYSSLRKFVKEVFSNSDELRSMLDTKIKKSINDYNHYEKYEIRLSEIQQQLDGLLKNVNESSLGKSNVLNKEITQARHQISPEPRRQSTETDYFENGFYYTSKSGKQLIGSQTNSLNASFKVYAVTGHEALFAYVGGARNENWFEGICVIDNAPNENLDDKKQIVTITPGKVRSDNDNWIVTKPAIIKFV